MTMATYIQAKPTQTGIGELLCGSEALSLIRRKLVGSIRGVAFLASAPFVGLAFVIALPVIGLGALLVTVREALSGREEAGCPHDSSAPTESSPETEDTMTTATEFGNPPVQGGTTRNPATTVTNAVVVSTVMGGGAMFFVSSLMYAALLSRLE